MRATIVKLENTIQDLTTKINDLTDQLNNHKKKREDKKPKPGDAFLSFGSNHNLKFNPSLNLSKKGDLYEAAQNLFDYLRKLDKLKMKRIAVMPIPEKGIGKTINERLIRASSDE